MKIKYLLIILCLIGCDNLGKKVENYDLFGLDKASEATKIQQEKIKAAQDYQKRSSTQAMRAYDDPNILQKY